MCDSARSGLCCACGVCKLISHSRPHTVAADVSCNRPARAHLSPESCLRGHCRLARSWAPVAQWRGLRSVALLLVLALLSLSPPGLAGFEGVFPPHLALMTQCVPSFPLWLSSRPCRVALLKPWLTYHAAAAQAGSRPPCGRVFTWPAGPCAPTSLTSRPADCPARRAQPLWPPAPSPAQHAQQCPPGPRICSCCCPECAWSVPQPWRVPPPSPLELVLSKSSPAVLGKHLSTRSRPSRDGLLHSVCHPQTDSDDSDVCF